MARSHLSGSIEFRAGESRASGIISGMEHSCLRRELGALIEDLWPQQLPARNAQSRLRDGGPDILDIRLAQNFFLSK
jgi:hypothetical protein